MAAEPGLRRWRRWTDWPLTALAAIFLALYAVQVLHVSADENTRAIVEAGIWVIWLVFVADYVIRFWLARRKLRFVLRNPFDLLVVVLPMLRQLRALRVVTIITLLNRRLIHTLHQRVAVYASGATILVGLCASLAVLDAERDAPDATITTFGDAAWWTLTTITTVGYGDRYPVTGEGRIVAATLMVGGIALLGVVTGLVASWFVRMLKGTEEAAAERAEQAEDVLLAEIAELRAEIRAMADHLAEQRRDD
ncbi:potassium channel family protein [Actinophytocola sp. S1-96]|uniref:Potassium channel family protein n=1 Tax=Actinophytocola gossypii TaxID=2812003 RepID=A0ABT2JDN8_9PSEU|nr:potassium channel family protein [Actinophytocola gossypii]